MTDDGGDFHTVLRFGVFELDARTSELRKHGVKIKLQGKPLQVLHALLERPGEIVPREALRARLWPSDVFVDFEAGLNTVANRLRIVLGDSAETPRYIETLPRVGYRFIAPVERVTSGHEVARDSSAGREQARLRRHARVAGASLAIAAVIAMSWFALRRPAAVTFDFRQVTFRHGCR
jgi:DNA-binding winged helix-turn-helix (wHTH) protein